MALFSAAGRFANVSFILADISSLIFASFLHLSQSFLTKRWPIIALMDGASKNGFVPIDKNLGTVPAASFVCIVDSTKCPVRAACMAISAVSKSRISPTKIISGSWRTIERRPLTKVYLSLICDWFTPFI